MWCVKNSWVFYVKVTSYVKKTSIDITVDRAPTKPVLYTFIIFSFKFVIYSIATSTGGNAHPVYIAIPLPDSMAPTIFIAISAKKDVPNIPVTCK